MISWSKGINPKVFVMEVDSSFGQKKLTILTLLLIRSLLLNRESRWKRLRLRMSREKENSWIKAGRIKAGNDNIKKDIYPRKNNSLKAGLPSYFYFFIFCNCFANIRNWSSFPGSLTISSNRITIPKIFTDPFRWLIHKNLN